jgi:heterodisulfide reductase subunit A
MYAIKQAVVTAEHLSGAALKPTIFFIDIRSHGKEFERYYDGAREGGVRFVRARPHTIDPCENGTGVRILYTGDDGQQVAEDFDLMVLSIGLEAPEDGAALAKTFAVRLNSYGFVETSGFEPVTTTRTGVFVTGAFQAPKDIPQSVTEASTAASEAARALVAARGSLTRSKTYPEELDTAGQTPSIGVFVCSCGINIANTVDVNAVVEYAKSLPHVTYVENTLFTCSADTQNLIAEKIREHGLNRIVIAACTPRTHEPLFQDTLREAGLNAYLIEMANIRNQNSWVHQKEPEKATRKAKDQVHMAVARVTRNYPLQQLQVAVVQKALVVGGGLAGMNAALALADQGFPCVLLEKENRLGGNAWLLNCTDRGEKIHPVLEQLIERVEGHERIEVIKGARLMSVDGSVGNFTSRVEAGGNTRFITYGAAVIATGGIESRPTEYLYGQDERIMTHLEFEAAMRDSAPQIRKAASVVFIQCVGSREPDRPYCSRVCCTHTMQSAVSLKTLNPEMNVYVLYRDIRTYGEREILYKKARDLGIIFIRFTRDDKPVASLQDDDLFIEVRDPVVDFPLKLYADYLVLAAAIVPYGNDDLVELYKCGVNADGFLNEAHPKLRPVDMPVDGLFVAGLCNFPKPIDESIAQARAAAARAGVILSRCHMQLDAVKSVVTTNCDGCALCVDVCPYNAIRLETPAEGGVGQMVTDPALCKGCGLCEATCPKGGILVHGFTLDQLRAQVDAALEAKENA